jgi:hypothetical protein
MDLGKEYRAKVLAGLPPMAEDAVWRAIDHHPNDMDPSLGTPSPDARPAPIECDRVGMCGEDAVWASRQGSLYVCNYHRFLLEVERTLQSIGAETITINH